MRGRSLTRKPETGRDVTAIGMSARLPASMGRGWDSAPWFESYGGLGPWVQGPRCYPQITNSRRKAVLLCGGRISYMICRTQ